VGLNYQTTIHCPANGGDFILGNDSRTASRFHNSMDPGRLNDLKLPIESAADKNVTGEKRQRQALHSVLPAANSGIERQENVEPFAGKNVGHSLLVLVADVNCMPVAGVGAG
jgi:hypothetical protein